MQRWTQAPAPGARPCRKERIAESSSGGFAIPIEPRMQQPRRPPNRCRPRTPASAAPVDSYARLEVLTQSGATDLQALSQACSPAGRKKFAPHLTGGLQCARRDQLQLIPLRTVSIAHRAPHRWNSALSGTRVVHTCRQAATAHGDERSRHAMRSSESHFACRHLAGHRKFCTT